MAFEAKNFVICSKFQLFKASCNLWLYSTLDTLEDCLSEHYFQPRMNLKNQDSPEVGDIIQCIVEGSKLAYLKIIAKTEKPYYITVARTFLENEADIMADITALQLEKASKDGDFATAITDENLGITQAEQTELEEKIDLAANSGRMITAQGFWYAKMYSATVAPAAEDGTNYADFSQVDGQGNPIIVTYNRVSGAWVQDETITPPADYDGYVPITSKIWDIAEQDGQQGGRILWNHTSKEFTPYPQIVSFDSIEITGDSTVEMPATPDDDNIANVGFVKNTIGAARNIGDIFFTARKDSALNGAVECDGGTYSTADFSGTASIGTLLALNKIPYVSLATYNAEITAKGWCNKFGWDGVGYTTFKVPTLNAFIWQKLQEQIVGTGMTLGLTNGNKNVGLATRSGQGDGNQHLPNGNAYGINVTTNAPADSDTLGAFGVTSDPDKSGIEVDTTNNVAEQRVMVQLAISATDEAVETCTAITSQVAINTSDISTLQGYDYVVESQLPTAQNNYTWYRKYKSGWVEQGGTVTPTSVGDHKYVVNIPVEMADANYNLQVTILNDTSNNNPTYASVGARVKYTTYFTIYDTTNVTKDWKICGMAA